MHHVDQQRRLTRVAISCFCAESRALLALRSMRRFWDSKSGPVSFDYCIRKMKKARWHVEIVMAFEILILQEISISKKLNLNAHLHQPLMVSHRVQSRYF